MNAPGLLAGRPVPTFTPTMLLTWAFFATVPLWINKGLEEVDGMTVDTLPVHGQQASHAPENMRRQMVDLHPRQDQVTGIVGDEPDVAAPGLFSQPGLRDGRLRPDENLPGLGKLSSRATRQGRTPGPGVHHHLGLVEPPLSPAGAMERNRQHHIDLFRRPVVVKNLLQKPAQGVSKSQTGLVFQVMNQRHEPAGVNTGRSRTPVGRRVPQAFPA